MNDVDVLVIGAGPTGLMMAAELARYGLSCRIIDKGNGPTDKSKALAIQPRTLEIFDHLGIADLFLKQGLQVHAANPTSRGKRLAHLKFAQLDTPYPFILSLEQNKTEKTLDAYLSSFGVQVERETELRSIKQVDQSIEAILYHYVLGQEEQIRARFAIGCDGSHSIVRKTLSLSFKGSAFSDIFSLADVQLDWQYPHDELTAFLNAKGMLVAIPLAGERRYRVIFQLEKYHNLILEKKHQLHGQISSQVIPDPTLEDIQNLISKYVSPSIHVTNPTWIANFHIHSRMVNTYQKGNIFLAGDAAHIHSPAGGQGMNTGIQDAFNLAWKLALVHRKQAHSSLLASYTKERLPIAKAVLKATKRLFRFATLRSPFLIAIRNWLISHVTRRPNMQMRVIRALSQIGIRYPKSSLVAESLFFCGGPNAGLRAPNAPILQDGKQTDLYSLWRKSTHYHVLFFSGINPTEEKIEEIKELANRFQNSSTKCWIISLEPSNKLLADPNRKAHTIYGVTEPSIYIIRPDLYIGCRTSISRKDLLETYFSQFLFS